MERKTGARGLRTILENVLLDTMYELPSLKNVSKVVVDETVIEGHQKPYVVYKSDTPRRRRCGSAASGLGFRSQLGFAPIASPRAFAAAVIAYLSDTRLTEKCDAAIESPRSSPISRATL